MTYKVDHSKGSWIDIGGWLYEEGDVWVYESRARYEQVVADHQAKSVAQFQPRAALIAAKLKADVARAKVKQLPPVEQWVDSIENRYDDYLIRLEREGVLDA